MQETREMWIQSLGQEDSPRRGNGNPLHYSCLENPTDRGAWWAIVHGVTKSWTWLKWLSAHAPTSFKNLSSIVPNGSEDGKRQPWWPSRESGVTGAPLPVTPTQVQTQPDLCCLPRSESGVLPVIFSLFKRKAYQKNRSYGHFCESRAMPGQTSTLSIHLFIKSSSLWL